jgi:hypothetical protein
MPPTKTDADAQEVKIPAAPSHLPKDVQAQWTKLYSDAYSAAIKDAPGNDRAARQAGTKAANALQRVTPPTSTAEIDALKDWQVVKRETKTIDNVPHRVCVTIDGQKYAFPVETEPAGDSGAASGKGSKAK